jgi:predicted dehydrogenase
MMRIKIGFTGTGYISQVHAMAAQKIDGVELVAVVNHRRESMVEFAEKFDIPLQYNTIGEMLADGEVDAVSVNTPNYLHAPETIAALNAGVHVMVEKPMAMNAGEAEKMLSASVESGSVLMVAHCWRFDEEVQWLKSQVDAGKLGKIVRTKGYSVHSNWGPSGWFTQAKYAGGGAMADMGVHAVDTVRFLLGDPQPVSVYARIGTYYQDFDVDDTGVIIVNWENGVVSYIESGWWQPHKDGAEASTQLYGVKGFGEVFPTRLRLPDPADQKVEEVDGGFPFPRQDQAHQVMYDGQLAYFIDCIREGKLPNPGGLEGLVNMQVVDAAYQSARTGKVVEL